MVLARSCFVLPLLVSLSTAAGCSVARSGPSDRDPTLTQDADVILRADQVSSAARWVSGDLHVHAECGEKRLTSEELLRQMESSGIEVASHLVWGMDWDQLHQSFTGKDDPASRPGRLLHSDLEISGFAAGQVGHLVLLGLSTVEFSANPTAAPRSGLPILDWALAQGPRVLAGYSHAWGWPATGFPPVPDEPDCCAVFELPISAMQGKTSFLVEEATPANAKDLDADLSTGPLSTGGFAIWKTLQNAGYRIAIGGGSDNGCINDFIGKPRTLALVDGEVSYDAFLEAIRRGRTILAQDRRDRVDLLLGDARIGSEVALAGPRPVEIELRAELAGATEIEILVNGEVKARVAASAGTSTARANVTIERSSWVVARTKRVLTSPIYVLVGEAPVRASAADACYLVKYIDRLKAIANQAVRPEQAIYLGSEKPATFAVYDAAKVEFEKRFREAGGTTCP
jgi:hypothetical protein